MMMTTSMMLTILPDVQLSVQVLAGVRRPTDHVLFGQHAHARSVQPEVVGESLVKVVLTQRPTDPFLDLSHRPFVRICKEGQETLPVELAHQMYV